MEDVSFAIGIFVVVCSNKSPFVEISVGVEVLNGPYWYFLNGRIVGTNLFPYLDGFFVGIAGYFLNFAVLLVVVVAVVVVDVLGVVDVNESLY